jgi:hypothetical protein
MGTPHEHFPYHTVRPMGTSHDHFPYHKDWPEMVPIHTIRIAICGSSGAAAVYTVVECALTCIQALKSFFVGP